MTSIPLVQWSKPTLVAGAFGAAFVVASGAFFVETLFRTQPPERLSIVVETTGSAPLRNVQAAVVQPVSAEVATPADCQTQTWPHIARPCLAGEKGPAGEPASRGVRMITTDKLTEPAISVVEKPPPNVVHRMAPPPAPSQPVSLFTTANATVPRPSAEALNSLAFAGRFQGMPETEKFDVAAAPASAAHPAHDETKAAKQVAQNNALRKPVKQNSKRQITRANDKTKSRLGVPSRPDRAPSSSSIPNGFPGGGPFGALFGNRANQ